MQTRFLIMPRKKTNEILGMNDQVQIVWNSKRWNEEVVIPYGEIVLYRGDVIIPHTNTI
jgi:hypothetical protein